MRVIQPTETRRRWTLRLAALAALVGLIAAFAPSLGAQGFPDPPHWFWGKGYDAFAGDTIRAVDTDGEEITSTTVNRDGQWSLTIGPMDHSKVKFELDADDGVRETREYDVVKADLTEIQITDFAAADQPDEDLVTTEPTTLDVRIRARLHPTRTLRTLEFNLIVNGEPLDPAPTRRYLGPSLEYDRWYQSSVIDAGEGFEVRIIACKQTDDDVIFGLRVEGHDDIVPQARRLPVSVTHNEWLRSSVIPIPQAGDPDAEVNRLRFDTGCTGNP